MKQRGLLIVAEGEKAEFDNGKRREVLPMRQFIDDTHDGTRNEYTLDDAVRFRMYVEMTRTGLPAKDACHFITDGLEKLLSGQLSIAPPRNYIKGADALGNVLPEVWIAREVYAADFVQPKHGFDRERLSIRHWAGTHDEVLEAINRENNSFSEDHRETAKIDFYSVTRAVRVTRNIADEIGLPEADDFGGQK